MSWYKLTSKQQDALVQDGLIDFITLRETQACQDCWHDFLADHKEQLIEVVLFWNTERGLLTAERLETEAFKDDRFRQAYIEHLQDTLS